MTHDDIQAIERAAWWYIINEEEGRQQEWYADNMLRLKEELVKAIRAAGFIRLDYQ